MRYFMGMFLLILATFKLLNIEDFVISYARYDFLANKFRIYGYIYPFLELLIGTLLIQNMFLLSTYIFLSVLMSFSSIGVIKSLFMDKTIMCACLGTVIKLPVSTITLVEDVGMTIMSIIMIIILVL
jgi:hypothetical protein